MEWLGHLFEKYPEMAVYLAIGLGYLIGGLKFRGAGIGAVTGSLLAGILVGNFFHVPELNPVLLLGGLAGAQTMTAGLAAVQEKTDSTVAVLGYSGTVAFGHILLTTCGTLIIALLS